MQRPPRRPDAPLLSGELLWRVAFVSALFAAFAFLMFTWAKSRGSPVEEARTLVVNTVVVMEVFYLFSVRYLHGPSLTWQGLLGTPAALIGIGGIVLLQFAFTYLPLMQRLFQTRSVPLLDGILVIGAGLMLFAILEAEKRLRRAWIART